MARLTGIRYIESKQKEATNEICGEQLLLNDRERQNADADADEVNSPADSTSNDTRGRPVATPVDPMLSKLLAALTRSVVDKQERKESKNRIQSEWSSIGAIFDRFFFLLFLTATVMITIVMIGVYPLFAATRVDVKISH